MGALKQYDIAKYQIDELRVGTRQAEKVVVWVEGNDWKLYGRFFKSDMVDPQGRRGGHSCVSAIESYMEFKKQFPQRRAIVIRDADFKRLNREDVNNNQDIFYADCHDHEMMCICQSKVREALMDNFMIETKDDEFFNMIFEELKLLSFLKWFNYNNRCSYNFKTLGSLSDLEEKFFKDPITIEAEVHKRTESSRKKEMKTTPLAHIDLKDYTNFMSERIGADYYELTNGHDFCNRFIYYLKKIDSKNQRTEEVFKELIYMAFSFVFQNTQLYERLCLWCNNNKTYILKAI